MPSPKNFFGLKLCATVFVKRANRAVLIGTRWREAVNGDAASKDNFRDTNLLSNGADVTRAVDISSGVEALITNIVAMGRSEVYNNVASHGEAQCINRTDISDFAFLREGLTFLLVNDLEIYSSVGQPLTNTGTYEASPAYYANFFIFGDLFHGFQQITRLISIYLEILEL